jgi:hypothetical protein
VRNHGRILSRLGVVGSEVTFRASRSTALHTADSKPLTSYHHLVASLTLTHKSLIMADGNQASVASTSNFQTTFGNMTDSQLRETLTQISNAANRPEQFQAFGIAGPFTTAVLHSPSPVPQSGNAKGLCNYACVTCPLSLISLHSVSKKPTHMVDLHDTSTRKGCPTVDPFPPHEPSKYIEYTPASNPLHCTSLPTATYACHACIAA